MKTFWIGFWELFRTSVIMQVSLAVLVTLTICIMYLQGKPVPLELGAAWMLILGFSFGAKTQHAIERDQRTSRSTEPEATE